MSKIIKKNCRCINCKKTSLQSELLNYILSPTMDLDTRRYTITGFDYLKYEIQKCPICGYANYDIENDNGMNITFSNNYVETLKDERINEKAKKFILAAIMYEQNQMYYEAGILYLKAAWIYDDLKCYENAKKMRYNSSDCLIKYSEENLDIDVIVLLIDILRRGEEFEEAQELLNKISVQDDDYIKDIIRFEEKLILNNDNKSYSIEVIYNE